MSEKIQEENKLSKAYELSESPIGEDEWLVELTKENVAKVEAMIRTDSNYRISLEDRKKSPYWILEMGKFLNGESCDHGFEVIIKNIVNCLDNENSTHLEADKVGRYTMISRIQEQKNVLWESLENRDRGFTLIEFLSRPTNPPPGKRSRRNISFASKFCHYSCFYLFKGNEAQDNFSIYDSVVAKALPKYLDYYRLNNEFNIKDKDYRNYSEAIDAIIEASKFQISRNGFDHLVWYYFKGKR